MELQVQALSLNASLKRELTGLILILQGKFVDYEKRLSFCVELLQALRSSFTLKELLVMVSDCCSNT